MNVMQQVLEGVKSGDVAGVEALIEGDPALKNRHEEAAKLFQT